jgi:hypothetical protein
MAAKVVLEVFDDVGRDTIWLCTPLVSTAQQKAEKRNEAG